MVYRSVTITSSHAAMGLCSIATEQNYMAVDELRQSGDAVTSKSLQTGSRGVQLLSNRSMPCARTCTALGTTMGVEHACKTVRVSATRPAREQTWWQQHGRKVRDS